MNVCLHICAPCSCLVPGLARRGCEQPCRCWQGTEPRAYAKATSTLNFLAISTPSVFIFYHLCMSLCILDTMLGYVRPCHNKQSKRGTRERWLSSCLLCNHENYSLNFSTLKTSQLTPYLPIIPGPKYVKTGDLGGLMASSKAETTLIGVSERP